MEDTDVKAQGMLLINHDGKTEETVTGIMTLLRDTGTLWASGKAPGPPISDDQRKHVEPLVDPHKAFDGAGLLKDFAARFRIDATVPPTMATYPPELLAYQGRLY